MEDHTGELELSVEAPTIAALFTGALALLAREVSQAPRRPGTVRSLDLRSNGYDDLLVALIDEATFLLEREGFVAHAVAGDEVSPGRLRGTLLGVLDPEARQLVKAATYHDLAVERSGGGWRARIVLDV